MYRFEVILLSIRLAVIGDLHYTVDETNTIHTKLRDDFYLSLLDAFFKTPADYHIALGDLTHYGNEAEWVQLMNLIRQCNTTYQRNFRYVLGNHDTLEISKAQIAEITRLPRYFQEELDACRCIYLDTSYEASPDNWGGYVDGEQIEWLSQLPIENHRPLLIFGHHPLPHTTTASERPMMRVENGNELKHALQPIGSPIVYFNGHNHRHSIAQHLNDYPNWTFVQSAAVLCAPMYRVVTVDTAEISMKTVDLSSTLDSVMFRDGIRGFSYRQDAAGRMSDFEVKVR